MKHKKKVQLFLKYLYEAHKKEPEVETITSEAGEVVGKVWTIEQTHLVSINDIASQFMTNHNIVLQRHDFEVITKELLEK